MAAIPLDKINYNEVSKYANVLIFKEFYPKTKNVSYYLKKVIRGIFVTLMHIISTDLSNKPVSNRFIGHKYVHGFANCVYRMVGQDTRK